MTVLSPDSTILKTPQTIRILGIDPGSRFVGFGCVDIEGKSIRHVIHGTWKILPETDDIHDAGFEKRLLRLYEHLQDVIRAYRPQILAIEKVFFAKNVSSALKLGHARGIVLLAGAENGLEIAEYSPTEIKSALTGSGRSEKSAVAKFVEWTIGEQEFKTWDASDALAVAIAHGRTLQTAIKTGKSGAGLRAQELFKKVSQKRKLSLAESVGHRSNLKPARRTNLKKGMLK